MISFDSVTDTIYAPNDICSKLIESMKDVLHICAPVAVVYLGRRREFGAKNIASLGILANQKA